MGEAAQRHKLYECMGPAEDERTRILNNYCIIIFLKLVMNSRELS